MNRFWTQTFGAMVAVVALAAVSPIQAGFINTLPSWDGFQGERGLGEPSVATFGQTITVGATETFLTDFSFQVATDPTNTSRFQAYVMAWDSVNKVAVGDVLFQSAAITNVGPAAPPSSYNAINVVTNVQLAANREYVLFFSTSKNFDGVNDFARLGSITPDVYSGGTFVYNNNENRFGELSTNPWREGSGGNDSQPVSDLAFTANLIDSPVNPTPAPAGVVLFGLGFAGLGMFRSFRRSKVVA